MNNDLLNRSLSFTASVLRGAIGDLEDFDLEMAGFSPEEYEYVKQKMYNTVKFLSTRIPDRAERKNKWIVMEEEIADLRNKLRIANAELSNRMDEDESDSELCEQTGDPKSQCHCFECWPEGQEGYEENE